MKSTKMIILVSILGFTLSACGGNTTNEKITSDSVHTTDTPFVKPGDSTSSYRNDRSTDSVSVGSTVPSKP